MLKQKQNRMNIEKLISKAFNRHDEPKQENTYTPKATMVCVQSTVYPNGKAQFSPNGTGEFYGLIGNTKQKK